jgi:nucleoid DNA-binding protein
MATATRSGYQNKALIEEEKFKSSHKIAREHRNVHKEEAVKIKPQKNIRVKTALIQN